MSSSDGIIQRQTLTVCLVETGELKRIPVFPETNINDIEEAIRDSSASFTSESSGFGSEPSDSLNDILLVDSDGNILTDLPNNDDQPIYALTFSNVNQNSLSQRIEPAPKFDKSRDTEEAKLRAMLEYIEASHNAINANLSKLNDHVSETNRQSQGLTSMQNALAKKAEEIQSGFREALDNATTKQNEAEKYGLDKRTQRALEETRLPQELQDAFATELREENAVLVDVVKETNKNFLGHTQFRDILTFHKDRLHEQKRNLENSWKTIKRKTRNLSKASCSSDMEQKYTIARKLADRENEIIQDIRQQVTEFLNKLHSLERIDNSLERTLEQGTLYSEMEQYFSTKEKQYVETVTGLSTEISNILASANSLRLVNMEEVSQAIEEVNVAYSRLKKLDSDKNLQCELLDTSFNDNFSAIKSAASLPAAFDELAREVTRRSQWDLQFSNQVIEWNNLCNEKCSGEREARNAFCRSAGKHFSVLEAYPKLASHFAKKLYSGPTCAGNVTFEHIKNIAYPQMTSLLAFAALAPSNNPQDIDDREAGWDFASVRRSTPHNAEVDSFESEDSLSDDEVFLCDSSGNLSHAMQQVHELEKALAESKADQESLQAALDTKIEEYDELEQKLKDSQLTSEQYLRDLRDLQEVHHDTKAEVAALKKIQNEQVPNLQEQLKETRTENALFESRIQQLEATLARKEFNTSFEQEYESLMGNHNSLKKEMQQLRNLVAELQSQNNASSVQNAQLQGRYQDLKQEHSQVMAVLEQQIEDHKCVIRDLQAREEELVKELESKSQDLQLLKKEYARDKSELESRIDALETTLADKSSNTSFEQEHEILRAENNSFKQQNQNLQRELKEHEENLDWLKEKLADTEAKYVSYKQLRMTLESEKDELATQLAQLEAANQQKMDEAKHQYQQLAEAYKSQQQIINLHKEEDKEKASCNAQVIQALREQIDQRNEQIDQRNAEIDQRNAEIEMLRNQVASTVKDDERVTELKQELRAEREHGAAEIQGLMDVVQSLRAYQEKHETLLHQLGEIFETDPARLSNDSIVRRFLELSTGIEILNGVPSAGSRLLFSKRGVAWLAVRTPESPVAVLNLSEEQKQQLSGGTRFIVGNIVYCEPEQTADGSDGTGLSPSTRYHRVDAHIELQPIS